MICPLVFRVVRLLIILAVGVFLAPAAMAAKAGKKSKELEVTGPVVGLSAFEVKAESMEFSHWRKVSSPHFVLYTDASAKEATKLVRQMEMMHQAVAFYLKRRNLKMPPMIVVLPQGRSDWRKFNSLGSVEWEVATSMVGEVRDLMLAEYEWSDDMQPVWSMLAIRGARNVNVTGPLWFGRGLQRFFGTVIFKGDVITLGKQGADAFWIRKYGWMEWPRFFAVTPSSPEFVKDIDDQKVYEGQCGVFGHHILTHADPTMVPRLLQWAAYLDAGNAPTEEAFRGIFQHGFKEWQKQISDMLDGGRYVTGTIKFPPAALQFDMVNASVGAREMRELFVLSQIMNQRRKESDEALDSLLARGLKTESLKELLADACERRGRKDQELELLRELIEEGSTNPKVYGRAAGLAMQRSMQGNRLDAKLGDEVGEIRDWCNKALAIEPLYAEANEVLAWAEALAPVVERRNQEVIVAICRRLDGNAKTDIALTALATSRLRMNQFKQARSLAEMIKNSPLSRASAKEMADAILAKVDAAATGQQAEAAGKSGS